MAFLLWGAIERFSIGEELNSITFRSTYQDQISKATEAISENCNKEGTAFTQEITLQYGKEIIDYKYGFSKNFNKCLFYYHRNSKDSDEFVIIDLSTESQIDSSVYALTNSGERALIEGISKDALFNQYKELLSEQTKIDLSANWKTYRNEKYGFEFEYPGNWVVSENGGNQISIQSALTNQPDITMSIGYEIKAYESGGDTQARLGCPLNTHEIECKILKNKNNITYIRSISTGQRELDHEQQLEVVFKSKQTMLWFTVLLTDENGNINPLSSDTIKIFDRTVSTLKFIEPVSKIDTSTWQTYRNEQYGFEVRYPNGWGKNNRESSVLELTQANASFLIKKIPTTNMAQFIKEERARINEEASTPHCTECGYGGPPSDPQIVDFHGLDAAWQVQGDESGLYYTITIPQRGLQIEYYYYEEDDLVMEALLANFQFIK